MEQRLSTPLYCRTGRGCYLNWGISAAITCRRISLESQLLGSDRSPFPDLTSREFAFSTIMLRRVGRRVLLIPLKPTEGLNGAPGFILLPGYGWLTGIADLLIRISSPVLG